MWFVILAWVFRWTFLTHRFEWCINFKLRFKVCSAYAFYLSSILRYCYNNQKEHQFFNQIILPRFWIFKLVGFRHWIITHKLWYSILISGLARLRMLMRCFGEIMVVSSPYQDFKTLCKETISFSIDICKPTGKTWCVNLLIYLGSI